MQFFLFFFVIFNFSVYFKFCLLFFLAWDNSNHVNVKCVCGVGGEIQIAPLLISCEEFHFFRPLLGIQESNLKCVLDVVMKQIFLPVLSQLT